MAEKIRKCKERLLIGEGDFGYTMAILKKHWNKPLAQAITATDLIKRDDCYSKNDNGTVEIKALSDRIEHLTRLGAKIRFNIDAQKIDEHFKGQRFKRIHWNCPFRPKTPTFPTDEQAIICFRKVLPKFMQACSKLQEVGDRVHVTLTFRDEHDRRQWENPVVLASIMTNYRLIKKRKFGSERYPAYFHLFSIGGLYELGGVERELVFEKIEDSNDFRAEDEESVVKTLKNLELDFDAFSSFENRFSVQPVEFEKLMKSAPAMQNGPMKKFSVRKRRSALQPADLADYEFVCSTDEDSSDYYETDEE